MCTHTESISLEERVDSYPEEEACKQYSISELSNEGCSNFSFECNNNVAKFIYNHGLPPISVYNFVINRLNNNYV